MSSGSDARSRNCLLFALLFSGTLLFFMTATSAFGQEDTCNKPLATVGDCDLKGNVHISESWKFVPTDRNPSAPHTFVTFSPEGKIDEEQIEKDGSLVSSFRYMSQDDGGTIIIESGGASRGRVTKPVRQVLSYDEQGHLVLLQTTSDRGILQDNEKSTFDKAGHKLSQEYYAADGSLSEHVDYKYDDQGHVIRECHPGIGYFEYQYPAPNREKKLYFPSDGSCDQQASAATPKWAIETTRDDAGRPVSEISTGEGATDFENWLWPYHSPKAGRVVKTYNEEGHLLHQTDYGINGGIEFTESDRYDSAGNMISQTISGDGFAEPHRFQFSYELDDFGNWVQKSSYSLGPDGRQKIFEVDYRKLTYYH